MNRAPLVVLVGQQDRRHLAFEPFLAGKLEGLAGAYPVWSAQAPRAEDLPGTIDRAYHEAVDGRGPALVVTPMDDWSADADEHEELPSPDRVVQVATAGADALTELAELIDRSASPALVVGAGADTAEGWAALVALAERLACPVWQESFGARAGFPQDHASFAGFLPADRTRLRSTLAAHDLVLVVGTSAFRQYGFAPGPLVEAGTRVAVVSDDAAEIHRSAAQLAVLAPPAAVCRALAERVVPRPGTAPAGLPRPAAPEPADPLRAGHVLAALAERLPPDVVLFEEAPSSRPELHARIPARAPLGFVSAAMGGLGFALPAATGLRMARPDRPVVAVVGDGSALYAIQALWSAARYEAGVLFVVLANGGYAVMNLLAQQAGGAAPWPGFDVDVAGIARSFGCPARRILAHDELVAALDEVVPGLAGRREPLLLEVAVEPDESFAP